MKDAQDFRGNSSLHALAMVTPIQIDSSIDLCNRIIDEAVSKNALNQRNGRGETPMTLAAINSYFDILELFLKKNKEMGTLDKEIKNNMFFLNPMVKQFFTSSRKIPIDRGIRTLELLVQYGFPLNQKGNGLEQKTPLDVAIDCNKERAIIRMLELGAIGSPATEDIVKQKYKDVKRGIPPCVTLENFPCSGSVGC